MASTSNHGPIPISSRTAPLPQSPIGHRGPLTSNPLCQLDVSLEPSLLRSDSIESNASMATTRPIVDMPGCPNLASAPQVGLEWRFEMTHERGPHFSGKDCIPSTGDTSR
jgi:hypothetical protein